MPDTKSTDSSNDTPDPVAVAVPVGESDTSVSTTRNNSAVKQGNYMSADQSSTSTVQSDNRNSSVNEADENSSWGVQIGSFKKTEAAESLSKQAKQKGYSVFIQQADVKGEKYHRVIVNAGNSQTRASEIEKNLKDDGFPTFLKRIR
jgi:cell division septation protein DedD